MLKQKTVLVLGAGASAPFGLPLGYQLTIDICEKTDVTQLRPWLESGEFSKADIKAFVSAFQNSGMSSIDAFLERRTEFLPIGQLAIAAILCRKEDPNQLFNPASNEHLYRAIWREMTNRADDPIQAMRNLNVITFNYDRSLEFFLHTALLNSFRDMDDRKAMEFLNRILILHVYGSLGAFHTDDVLAENKRAFRRDPSPRSISTAASQIRLIAQGRHRDNEFMHTRNLFADAEVICFLGFGFDETNVQRLNLASVLRHLKEKHQPPPRIIMSTMGKSNAQVEKIKDALCLDTPVPIESYSMNGLRTLAEAGVIG